MSVSSQIAAELKARLQAINQMAGFHTDAGQNVALGWREIRADEPLPCLTLIETGHTIDGDAVRGRNLNIRIDWTVEALTEIDGDLLPALYDLEDDVLRALLPQDLSADGRYVRLHYRGREIVPPEDGSRLAAVRVNFYTIHQQQLI
ncbi:MAG TPA: hypothetical protein ENI90_00025 [Methylothermaceae bacterium]|nr:hypothetical protein [Methylothermaceae bacterium]